MLLDVECSEDENHPLKVETWRSLVFVTTCDTLVFFLNKFNSPNIKKPYFF